MTNPAPLVIKIGGAAIDDGCDSTFAAVAHLHLTQPGGVVVVHGGGKLVDQRLGRLGITSEKREGVRITPPEHIAEVVATLAGVVSTMVVGGLQRWGVSAVGLTLGDGLTANASTTDAFAFDPGRVGKITGGDPALARALLKGGFLPVFSSIALDAQGQTLNVNADDAAASLACVLGARGLILLTDTPGILDAAGALIASIGAADAERQIVAGTISGGMIPKVRGALRAANAAGIPAVIASAANPDNLAQLAHGEGVGTRVLPAAHTVVRPARERTLV